MLLLVTGASGAGKSTVRARIAADLAPEVECVELAGLLSVPAVPTIAWRQHGAEAAVRRAIALSHAGRHLLLAGDPVAAGEVLAAPSAPALGALAACLLDVGPAAQARRLRERGDDPRLLDQHQGFAAWMRGHAGDPAARLEVLTTDGWEAMRWERLTDGRAWAMDVVDTSELGPEEVAERVRDWVRRVLAGTAPRIVTA